MRGEGGATLDAYRSYCSFSQWVFLIYESLLVSSRVPASDSDINERLDGLKGSILLDSFL